MCKVSVIVPVYKAEEHLLACLESISKQTIAEQIQLILVDDGSPDSCGKICDEFAAANPNTLVIHQENGGVSSARNAGLKIAQGEYIGFVDADDTVRPDYYEKLLSAILSNNCDMAFSSLTLIYHGEERLFASWYPCGTVLDKKNIISDFAIKMLSDGSQNSACLKLFRKSIIRENNLLFPVGVKIAEDKRFVAEFLYHCNSAVYAGDCGYFYRDNPNSAMHTDKKMTELLSTYDDEITLFTGLGIDRNIVLEKKSVYLFLEFADFLQRSLSQGAVKTCQTIKKCFANRNLMIRIDNGLDSIQKSYGRIYRWLALSVKRKSIIMTLLVLLLQKAINERGIKNEDTDV